MRCGMPTRKDQQLAGDDIARKLIKIGLFKNKLDPVLQDITKELDNFPKGETDEERSMFLKHKHIIIHALKLGKNIREIAHKKKGYDALIVAVGYEMTETVRYLLKQKASIFSFDDKLDLDSRLEKGYKNFIKRNPIFMSAQLFNTDVLTLMLETFLKRLGKENKVLQFAVEILEKLAAVAISREATELVEKELEALNTQINTPHLKLSKS